MERAQLAQIVHATGAAEQHGAYVFLCDPHWSAAQRARFLEIAAQARQAVDEPKAGREGRGVCARLQHASRGWLCIPTGGSSGGLKFVRHDELSLSAAVRGFCAHFGVARVNAVDVLPPWHVSGLMARLRCAATGGTHLPWDWKRLEAGDFPKNLPSPFGVSKGVAAGATDAAATETSAWFLSLVPTQLQRLLKQGERACEWLRRFDVIFVGGGPLWCALADEAAAAGLPIILSYGMTETGAMIAAQRRGDFAHGDRSSGLPMPQAQVEISREGVLHVRGESVMLGYWGEAAQGGVFTTADLARLDEAGRLHILGRRDEVAISGGEKVRLAEVEDALRAATTFEDVAVCAVPDREWGEAVVACYLSAGSAPLSSESLGSITASLARHQRPKHWLAFAREEWPRNAQGKLNRATLCEAASARLKEH